jgi:AhpD family alkylhydroperoxidase
MRIHYAPSSPPSQDGDQDQITRDIYDRIAARRHPRPLISLDLALLHSPPVADGWNSFLGAIRSHTVLDAGLLELAVCRVALLNDAVYEWNAHAPLALKAGVKPEQLQEVKELDREFFLRGRSSHRLNIDASTATTATDGEDDNKEGVVFEVKKRIEEGSTSLTLSQWVVLAYTDQMTKMVKVDEEVFQYLGMGSTTLAAATDKDDQTASAGAGFSHREIVELTAAVVAYNCVSRFLVALDVGENNGKEMKHVDQLLKDLGR